MKRGLLPYQIVMGVTSAAIGGIVAVLGELRDELGFSDTEIGIVVSCGFLAAFVAQVGFARFADRGHGRLMATIGTALASLALLVMVFADSVVTWGLSRAALGFAGGLILPGIRRAATVLDPANVGENLGRLVVGEVLGFVMGPVISALLVEVGDIRTPFAVFAVGTALFIPFVLRLPGDAGQQDMSESGSSLDLLRGRRLQGALLLIFGYFMLIGAFESVLPVMFQDRGGSSLDTGLAFTFLALPIAFVSTRAGRTADRLGAARVATIGMAIVGAVTMTYGFLPGIVIPVVVMALVGLADGYGFTAGQVAVSRAVPEARQASALGLMGASEVLGAGVAAIPAAVLYDAAGEEVAWMATGAATLVLVLVGHLRLRGTEPVNTSGTDLDWTPVDRHPVPDA